MLLHRTQRSVLPVGSVKPPKTRRRWPTGQVMPLVACGIVVLLGAISLGTDVAVQYYNWMQLQKAVDAAVIAGGNSLPENPTQAITIAKQYAEANNIAAAEIKSTTVAVNDLSISMSVQRTVPYFFARVLGLTTGIVKASATAVLPPPTYSVGAPGPGPAPLPAPCNTIGSCQLIPIGLDHNTVYSYDNPITLNQGEVGPGNWDLLALGGVGGNNLRGNIADGYSGLVTVGDWVTTEPGKKVGPVDQGFQDRINTAASVDPNGTFSNHIGTNPRVFVLPVVDWEHQNGRTTVQVDAFATLWLDSYCGETGAPNGCKPGQVFVHFISQVVANSYGDASAPNFGGVGHPFLKQ